MSWYCFDGTGGPVPIKTKYSFLYYWWKPYKASTIVLQIAPHPRHKTAGAKWTDADSKEFVNWKSRPN